MSVGGGAAGVGAEAGAGCGGGGGSVATALASCKARGEFAAGKLYNYSATALGFVKTQITDLLPQFFKFSTRCSVFVQAVFFH